MSERIAQGRAAVERWMQFGPGWGPEHADVTYIPHLSTPHFDIFVVSQRAVSGSAGEIYLLSDGERVTPGGSETFAALMRAEGAARRPDALPPALVARLLLSLGMAGPGHLIDDPGDPALDRLGPTLRAGFQPPTASSDGDGVRLSFWVAAINPARIERWHVRIAADGVAQSEVLEVEP